LGASCANEVTAAPVRNVKARAKIPNLFMCENSLETNIPETPEFVSHIVVSKPLKLIHIVKFSSHYRSPERSAERPQS
jgi:hypothetical protein